MAWITPITDRSAADIAAQNSKAFWNVADWVRVYNNAQETNAKLASEFGASITLDTLATPTTTTIQNITEMNVIPKNIELMRSWVVNNTVFYPAELDTEIKDDYSAGQSETAPNYVNVNRWENHLYLMYNLTYDYTYIITQDDDFVVSQDDDYLVMQ
ncbi:MAG: hypothetical protein DSY80_05850 [Desulfocapsa sp.]|nr:MAG: hypothetical protein DSY80_05850 [Desulfocapsa sp.]